MAFGVWYALGAAGRFLIWAFLLAVVIRMVKPYTVSEWFALRYDSKNGVLASLLNIVTGLGLLGAQFVAFGAIASTFMGWELTTGILAGFTIVMIYTTVSGMFGIAWTDMVQFFVAAIGALLVLGAAAINFGTMDVVRAELPQAGDARFVSTRLPRGSHDAPERIETALDGEDAARLRAGIEDTWVCHIRQEGRIGFDGALWMIEGTDGVDYCAVETWSPRPDTPLGALGRLLVELTGRDIPEQDVY
jgi:hypothetical protein